MAISRDGLLPSFIADVHPTFRTPWKATILVGLLAITMFLMHGSIYLHLKTTGELQERIVRWMWRSYGLFVTMYVIVTAATWFAVPRATEPFAKNPLTWLVVPLGSEDPGARAIGPLVPTRTRAGRAEPTGPARFRPLS